MTTYTKFRGVKFENVEKLPEVGGFFHGEEVKKVELIDDYGENDWFRVETLSKDKDEQYTYYVTLLHKWIATEEEGREDFKFCTTMTPCVVDIEPDPDYSKDYIRGFNDAKREWLKVHANDQQYRRETK